MTFLDIGIIDILDIFLVAFLFYQIYNLVKGTAAIRIFVGIAMFYLIWLLVKVLDMQLLSTILGHVMGVGVIALLIVFQQEIRRFFMILGTKYLSNINYSIDKFFSYVVKKESDLKIDIIIQACENLASTNTGALIAISKRSELSSFAESGVILNADTSSSLIESIF